MPTVTRQQGRFIRERVFKYNFLKKVVSKLRSKGKPGVIQKGSSQVFSCRETLCRRKLEGEKKEYRYCKKLTITQAESEPREGQEMSLREGISRDELLEMLSATSTCYTSICQALTTSSWTLLGAQNVLHPKLSRKMALKKAWLSCSRTV